MKLKRLLSLAVLCVAGWTGNAYAYEVGQDITASVQKEWYKGIMEDYNGKLWLSKCRFFDMHQELHI